MADPSTAMIFAAASKAVGAATNFIGGMGAASQYDAQSRLAKANAASASAQADAAEEAIRRKGRQGLGEQVAGIAESGAGFTQTARDLMDQAGANVSFDALNQRFDGAQKRTQFLNESAFDHVKARGARIGAWGGLGSDLLSLGSTLSAKPGGE